MIIDGQVQGIGFRGQEAIARDIHALERFVFIVPAGQGLEPVFSAEGLLILRIHIGGNIMLDGIIFLETVIRVRIAQPLCLPELGGIRNGRPIGGLVLIPFQNGEIRRDAERIIEKGRFEGGRGFHRLDQPVLPVVPGD